MMRDELSPLPGERGWISWKDIAETDDLIYQPNPADRGFISSPGRTRLQPIDAPRACGNETRLPGDHGWVPWVKLGCMPRRVPRARRIEPIQQQIPSPVKVYQI